MQALKAMVRYARLHGTRRLLRELHREFIRRFHPAFTGFLPISAEVEITTHCNLECSMCRGGFGLGSRRPPAHMPPDLFQSIVDRMPFLDLYAFRGAGEPVLSPYLLDLASLVKRAGKRLIVFTNGMEMTRDIASRLIALDTDEIYFSIDAGTPQVYEKIRRGGCLETVLGNLREAGRLARGSAVTQVHIMFVLMRTNRGEIAELLRLVDGTGASTLVVKQLSPGRNRALQEESLSFEESEEVRERARALPTREIRVVFSEDLHREQTRDWLPCMKLWESPFISVEGHVGPCPMVFYEEGVSYGLLPGSRFRRLWNCDRIREHRRDLLEGKLEVCAECPVMRYWAAGA